MIEPFTIAEQVCSRAEINKDDIVFIMGAGPVGLSILRMVKLYGATCFISDVFDYKLQIASQYGADVIINAKDGVREEIMRLTECNGAPLLLMLLVQQDHSNRRLHMYVLLDESSLLALTKILLLSASLVLRPGK